MKCKFCNTELQEGQAFCNQCGNKVEVDLNAVDKTSIDSNGVMTYDFDFSDQVVNNTPKHEEPVVNEQPVVQNVEQPVASEQPVVQNVEQPVVNEQPVVQEEKVVNSEPNNNPNTVPTVDAKNNNYSVLDEKDLNRKYNLMPIYMIGVVLLAISGFFFYQNVIEYKPNENNQGNNNENNQEVIEDNNVVEEPKEEEKEENKVESNTQNKEENNIQIETTDVSYSGFILKIPNNLLYDFDNDYLLVYPQDESWAAAISVTQGSFQAMKANKEQAKKILEDEGITVKTYNLSYYGGTEWLSFEIELLGEKSLLGYADAPKENCFVVVLSSPDGSYNYKAYKSIAPILQSAR